MTDIVKLFDDNSYELSLLASYFNRYPDVLFFAACAKGPWEGMTTLEIITFAEYLKKTYAVEL